jgi:hypothetical protein
MGRCAKCKGLILGACLCAWFVNENLGRTEPFLRGSLDIPSHALLIGAPLSSGTTTTSTTVYTSLGDVEVPDTIIDQRYFAGDLGYTRSQAVVPTVSSHGNEEWLQTFVTIAKDANRA